PYEQRAATSGIRLGTPIVTRRGMCVEEMGSISGLVTGVLREVKIVSDSEYKMDEFFKERIRTQIKELCGRFPLH
ncbi:MAG: hypothetical protein AMJ43_06635, partial [Coxiella sp. DG_40]